MCRGFRDVFFLSRAHTTICTCPVAFSRTLRVAAPFRARILGYVTCRKTNVILLGLGRHLRGRQDRLPGRLQRLRDGAAARGLLRRRRGRRVRRSGRARGAPGGGRDTAASSTIRVYLETSLSRRGTVHRVSYGKHARDTAARARLERIDPSPTSDRDLDRDLETLR